MGKTTLSRKRLNSQRDARNYRLLRLNLLVRGGPLRTPWTCHASLPTAGILVDSSHLLNPSRRSTHSTLRVSLPGRRITAPGKRRRGTSTQNESSADRQWDGEDEVGDTEAN